MRPTQDISPAAASLCTRKKSFVTSLFVVTAQTKQKQKNSRYCIVILCLRQQAEGCLVGGIESGAGPESETNYNVTVLHYTAD